MRPKLMVPLAGLLLLACIGFYATSDAKAPTPATTEDGLAVYFSPKGGCTEAIVDAPRPQRRLVATMPFGPGHPQRTRLPGQQLVIPQLREIGEAVNGRYRQQVEKLIAEIEANKSEPTLVSLKEYYASIKNRNNSKKGTP